MIIHAKSAQETVLPAILLDVSSVLLDLPLLPPSNALLHASHHVQHVQKPMLQFVSNVFWATHLTQLQVPATLHLSAKMESAISVHSDKY